MEIEITTNKKNYKEQCIENIKYLAKQHRLTLGELETKSGVSAGYLSRLEKMPSVEMLANAAKLLHVTIDDLIYSNYSGMDEQEQYMYNFIEKMFNDTKKGNIHWKMETAANFDKIERGDVYDNDYHPLYHYNSSPRNGGTYDSGFAGGGVGVKNVGPGFNAMIGPSTRVYIMNTFYDVDFQEGFSQSFEDVKELYIVKNCYSQYAEVKPVISEHKQNREISCMLEKLYIDLYKKYGRLGLNEDITEAIDLYMSVTGDPEKIPF